MADERLALDAHWRVQESELVPGTLLWDRSSWGRWELIERVRPGAEPQSQLNHPGPHAAGPWWVIRFVLGAIPKEPWCPFVEGALYWDYEEELRRCGYAGRVAPPKPRAGDTITCIEQVVVGMVYRRRLGPTFWDPYTNTVAEIIRDDGRRAVGWRDRRSAVHCIDPDRPASHCLVVSVPPEDEDVVGTFHLYERDEKGSLVKMGCLADSGTSDGQGVPAPYQVGDEILDVRRVVPGMKYRREFLGESAFYPTRFLAIFEVLKPAEDALGNCIGWYVGPQGMLTQEEIDRKDCRRIVEYVPLQAAYDACAAKCTLPDGTVVTDEQAAIEHVPLQACIRTMRSWWEAAYGPPAPPVDPEVPKAYLHPVAPGDRGWVEWITKEPGALCLHGKRGCPRCSPTQYMTSAEINSKYRTGRDGNG